VGHLRVGGGGGVWGKGGSPLANPEINPKNRGRIYGRREVKFSRKERDWVGYLSTDRERRTRKGMNKCKFDNVVLKLILTFKPAQAIHDTFGAVKAQEGRQKSRRQSGVTEKKGGSHGPRDTEYGGSGPRRGQGRLGVD